MTVIGKMPGMKFRAPKKGFNEGFKEMAATRFETHLRKRCSNGKCNVKASS